LFNQLIYKTENNTDLQHEIKIIKLILSLALNEKPSIVNRNGGLVKIRIKLATAVAVGRAHYICQAL